jgi:DNA adenine methylase
VKDIPLLSPLRYPGSKRGLVGYIKQALEINKCKPALYIEPFVGGASVALQLMQDGLIQSAILMDVDPWIASFWQTVFFDTDWLVEQVQTIDVTLEQWYRLKRSRPITTREQALAFFFLNRTSFSGILEAKAGPLGGRQQNSPYKIDCRFPRATLVRRIRQAATHTEKVYAVWSCSWEDGIAKIRDEQRVGRLPCDGLFFYLDPPFFDKAEDLYRYYFAQKDHVALRDFLLTLEDKWILSYDSAQQVEALYGQALKKRVNGTQKHHVELFYSLAAMSKRQKGQEVIISNLEELPVSPAIS